MPRTNIKEIPNSPLTFSRYQREVEATDDRKRLLVSLLGLVGEIGDIQTVFKRRMELRGYPGFNRDLAEEIGDTLWYLASLASRLHLSFEAIAKTNIVKARELHSQGTVNRFDSAYPRDERFLRKFQVEFKERAIGRGAQVKIIVNGVFVGDELTDNAEEDDGYRYHDAFHLAYAAVLGWSPVVRALLRRKRKSNPAVDEVQDGARARVVEEAISLYLFNQAKSRDYFSEPNSVDISLLKTVKRLCGDLEVKACTAKQWQSAILQGYALFRALRDNRGGIVNLDLDKAEAIYKPSRASLAKGGRRARRKATGLSRRLAGRGKASTR